MQEKISNLRSGIDRTGPLGTNNLIGTATYDIFSAILLEDKLKKTRT
jgi:hypothetical protein